MVTIHEQCVHMPTMLPSLATVIALEPDNRRKPNFTDSEKLFIIAQYHQYKPVLRIRGSSSEKSEIWNRITDGLNARNPSVHRTMKDVRKKWKNLVAQSRKEFADYRQNQGQAQLNPPSPLALKVLELVDEIIIQSNTNAINSAGDIDAAYAIPVSGTADTHRIKQECDEENDYDEVNLAPQADEKRNFDFGVDTVANVEVRLSPRVSIGQLSTAEASSSYSQSSLLSSSDEVSFEANNVYEEGGVVSTAVAKKDRAQKRQLPADLSIEDVRTVRSVKELKRLKLQLETEKLILEKRKLSLEIELLSQQLRTNQQ